MMGNGKTPLQRMVIKAQTEGFVSEEEVRQEMLGKKPVFWKQPIFMVLVSSILILFFFLRGGKK